MLDSAVSSISNRALVNNPSLLARRGNAAAVAAAGLILFVCLFRHLGAIGLVGPDEPRYAWIARAMASSGDWVTPRLYGQPWFEKPILYYWAAGVGFLLHLPAEWAARLPSACAALVAAVAIGWLGWKHYGSSPRPLESPWLLAPLIFATSVAAIGFARAASPDMLFSAALTLAMASSATVLRKRGALRSATGIDAAGENDYLALACFGASLGLAVLAKGPAGVVLAGGGIAIWALAGPRWRDAFRLAHPAAFTVFCLVALPWYVICARRNPEFLQIFIFQHNFERYLTPLFQHRQPFWFFVPILVLGLLPWTVLLWPAAQEGLRLWREKSWRASPGFFFACWAFFPLLFFSFSQSKLPGYILPTIPPVALLLAIGVQRRIFADPANQQSESHRRLAVALGATWIVMALSGIHWMNGLPAFARDSAGKAIWAAAIVASFGGVAIAVLGLFRKREALTVSFFLVAFCVETAGSFVLPALDPLLSARFHGNLLRNSRYPDRIFTFKLARSWQYGLNFYLQREIPEWVPSDWQAALVLTTPQGLAEIRKLGRVEGGLEEPYGGIVYVPIFPAPR
jgi:4-amino-4-deoxy-L-arabinose transferase-like glycosyltransferase